ncbi:MAG TPA: hypothetical protein VK509_07955 [Polyangiales bacterium]|nr:hypothetical protein [Polyangiales bacterium]
MTRRRTDFADTRVDSDVDDAELSSAISALRGEQGSAEQAFALEQRLLATLGPAAFAGPGAVGGACGFGAAGFGGGGWLLALVGFGAALLSPPAAQPQASSVQVVSEARVHVSAISPTPRLAPLPLASAERVAPAAPSPRVARARARAAKVAAPARVPSALGRTPMPEAELQLLLRARRSLRRDPSAARALLEQHAATYPDGVFAQERELISVEALLRQRARSEAFWRAERFIARYPSSPYAVRLRSMLEQLPKTDDLSVAERAAEPSAAP